MDKLAVSATLHCLAGCAIGEVSGMMIGAYFGLSNLITIALAVSLAFLTGYTLSLIPVVTGGIALGAAMKLVLAADTLSITVMEIVDNLVIYLIPGALDAKVLSVQFWMAMAVGLTAAFFAAYPVNKYLLARGKGHAITHQYVHKGHEHELHEHHS